MKQSLFSNLPVLIVDDEEESLQSCEMILNSGGIDEVITCADSSRVMRMVQKEEIGAVLLDLSMPEVSGKNLLASLNQDYPYLPVIVVTAMDDVSMAVKCMKLGAFDYMVKPVEKSRMISGVKRALEIRQLRREYNILSQRMLSDRIEHPGAFREILTNHARMLSIFRYAEAVAKTMKPVLITGETGVGKEMIATAIHRISGRKGEFVAVNVAGLDDNMFSDTLFGHIKGAFTGAGSVRSGLVEKASGGTLFLDEIGDLSTASQVKLLRLLQEREYLPMGSDVWKLADARVITSTNQDLHKLQKTGQFRKDLYYRIKTHHIQLPPLRDRKSDLPLLIDYFLEKASHTLGKKKPNYPRELITLLSTYHFPGNVRELEAMIYDALSRNRSGNLSLKTFQDQIGARAKEVSIDNYIDLSEEGNNIFAGVESLPSLKEANRLLITEALKRTGGNQSMAARILGITQSALNKRLKRAEGKNNRV